MNKEDIDRAVADLVEAIRIDAAIEMAKSDCHFLALRVDEAYEAADLAEAHHDNAKERLLELQRHKRDVDVLKERLSSLLAENNATIDQIQVDTVTVTQEDRLRYVRETEKSPFAPSGYRAPSWFVEGVDAGKYDDLVATWMTQGGNIFTK